MDTGYLQYCALGVLVVGFLVLLSHPSFSQDLEDIGQRPLVSTSGGFSATTTFYHVEGVPTRRDPFYWQLNANLNFNILGIIQAPFSMTFTQQQKRFSQPQPFNRFGMSPTYKAYTLHVGHRSMHFSNYTLAGNLFFGVGAEYTPEDNPVRVQMMYGRFAKPVSRFARGGQVFAEPTFRRIGYGAKIGFQHKGQESHVIIFKGKDDAGSISGSDTLDIRPEENLVLGWVGNFRIAEKLSWSTEYAFSMYSRDITTAEIFIDEFTFVNNLGNLFTPRASSSYNHALSSRLGYAAEGFQANVDYRRVDPGYTTHGSSFLNNDFEDVSAALTVPFLRQSLSVNGRVGLQHNNLDERLNTTIRRFIYSAGANARWSDRWNIALNYANFNTNTRQSVIQRDILIDTLEYVQVTRSGSAMINYAIGSDEQSGLSATANWQDVDDNGGSTSVFQSYVLSYQRTLLSTWQANFSVTANQSGTNGITSLTTGPVVNVSRSFQQGRYRTAFGFNQLIVTMDGRQESTVSMVRLMNSGRLGEKHNLALNVYYVSRAFRGEIQKPNVKEFRATFNYSFRI